MIPLYFIILFASGIVPVLFSIFGIDFIKNWKNFIISTTLMAAVFLVWDAVFTHYGIWGFNEDYNLGIYFLKMPIEEWLFFFVIPFCSLFTHFALFYAFPNLRLSKRTTLFISIIIIGFSFILVVVNLSKAYTAVNFSFLLIVIGVGIILKSSLLRQFYISFLIVLIPFFIVNGILTGAITDTPVVWYDNSENLGTRLYTIPIEDIGYAFSLLFGNLMIFDFLNSKQNHKANVPLPQ